MPRPSLAGKKGVILFEVSGWSDAQGHATLFNGQSCYDHCYFNEPEAKILHGPCELLGLAMKSIPLCLALVTSTLLSFTVHAADQALISPQAGARTYAQNYKDMVLATCMTQAYRNDTSAATDAGSSASALRDWTYFDMEKSPDAVKSLVNRYLARNYSHPLVESEIKESGSIS